MTETTELRLTNLMGKKVEDAHSNRYVLVAKITEDDRRANET